jgi:hypothetical protein
LIFLLVLAIALLGLFIFAAVRDLRGGWIPGGVGELRSSAMREGKTVKSVVLGEAGTGWRKLGTGGSSSSSTSTAATGVANSGEIVPSFPLTRLAVRDEPAFQDVGEAGHEAWLRMFPRGNGLVRVEEPRKHRLPRSRRVLGRDGRFVGEAEVFEVAVVRELECLLAVRDLLRRWEEVLGGTWDGEGLEDWERRDGRRCLDHCEFVN